MYYKRQPLAVRKGRAVRYVPMLLHPRCFADKSPCLVSHQSPLVSHVVQRHPFSWVTGQRGVCLASLWLVLVVLNLLFWLVDGGIGAGCHVLEGHLHFFAD